MRTKILFLLSIISVISFGQTKKATKTETQQWIKEKLEQNSYSDADVTNIFEITYDDTSIIIKNKGTTKFGILNEYYKAKIVDINSISVSEEENYVLLKIKLNIGKKPIIKMNGEYKDYGDYVPLSLNKIFMQNNLPERLQKAFSRLIELYGGKKVSETGEPF